MTTHAAATGAVCGCDHPVSAHTEPGGGCSEWRRYPEVLIARPCYCMTPWTPPSAREGER